MEVKKVFRNKEQFLRRIERFYDMGSNFLTTKKNIEKGGDLG